MNYMHEYVIILPSASIITTKKKAKRLAKGTQKRLNKGASKV